MYSMGRGVPYSCPVFGYRYSATLAPIGVKFCMMVQYIFVPDVSSPLLGPIAPRGVHYKENMLHFLAFMQYHL